MDFNTVMSIMGLASNVENATDANATAPDRFMAGVNGVGTALTLGGTALTAGTGVGTSLGLPTLATIMGGASAGVATGTAALTAGSVLSAAAGGYGFGTAMDKLGGRAMGALGSTREVTGRGVHGGTTRVADDRRLSERMADATHTQTGDRLALAIAPYLPTWLGGG